MHFRIVLIWNSLNSEQKFDSCHSVAFENSMEHSGLGTQSSNRLTGDKVNWVIWADSWLVEVGPKREKWGAAAAAEGRAMGNFMVRGNGKVENYYAAPLSCRHCCRSVVSTHALVALKFHATCKFSWRIAQALQTAAGKYICIFSQRSAGTIKDSITRWLSEFSSWFVRLFMHVHQTKGEYWFMH